MDPARGQAMGDKVSSHLADIVGRENNGRKPVLRPGPRGCLQFKRLKSVANGKTRMRSIRAEEASGPNADEFAIEVAGFVEVSGIEADTVDARDAGALRRVLRAGVKRGQLKKQPSREKDCGVLHVNAHDSD